MMRRCFSYARFSVVLVLLGLSTLVCVAQSAEDIEEVGPHVYDESPPDLSHLPFDEELSTVEGVSIVRVSKEDGPPQNRSVGSSYGVNQRLTMSQRGVWAWGPVNEFILNFEPTPLKIRSPYPSHSPDVKFDFTFEDVAFHDARRAIEHAFNVQIALVEGTDPGGYTLIAIDADALPGEGSDDNWNSATRESFGGTRRYYGEDLWAINLGHFLKAQLDCDVVSRLPISYLDEIDVTIPDFDEEVPQTTRVEEINNALKSVGMKLIEANIAYYELEISSPNYDTSGTPLYPTPLPAPDIGVELSTVEGVSLVRLDVEPQSRNPAPSLAQIVRAHLPVGVHLNTAPLLPEGYYAMECDIEEGETRNHAVIDAVAGMLGRNAVIDLGYVEGASLILLSESPYTPTASDADADATPQIERVYEDNEYGVSVLRGYELTACSMEDLAEFLTTEGELAVDSQTGLTGRYDLTLERNEFGGSYNPMGFSNLDISLARNGLALIPAWVTCDVLTFEEPTDGEDADE